MTGNNNLAGGILAGTTVNGSSNAAFGDNAGRNVNGNSNIAIGRLAGRHITASHTVAIGTAARATANNAVAIGQGSLANLANTVSVGSTSNRRRIVNVAPGVSPTDAVNLAQLQAATSSAAPVGADNAKRLIDDIRQEMMDLRALVQGQQQEIAQLKAAQEARRSASN